MTEPKLFIFCPNCHSPYFRKSEKTNIYRECDSCGYVVTFYPPDNNPAEQKSNAVDGLK